MDVLNDFEFELFEKKNSLEKKEKRKQQIKWNKLEILR